MSTTSTNDLDSLFERELQTVNDDVRKKAAFAAFEKLRPSNSITVEQFLAGLERHKDMWAVVSTLRITDFAEALVGKRAPSAASTPAPQERYRTRINDDQKNS